MYNRFKKRIQDKKFLQGKVNKQNVNKLNLSSNEKLKRGRIYETIK